jgi:hypothetical protein
MWNQAYTEDQLKGFRGFFAAVSKHCKKLSGDLPVTVSPFFNPGLLGADAFAETYGRFLRSGRDTAGIDIVMLQDSVGANSVVWESHSLMHDYYYFFLSYARINYDNAVWNKQGVNLNFLDEFYNDLCREVSERTGRAANEVAYRDKRSLKMGEPWDHALVEGLQKSRVLLPLISPHYLRSDNCGRELEFFERRMSKYLADGGAQQSHRIIPLFWQNPDISLKNIPSDLDRYLRGFEFTQHGMPESYPAVALWQISKLRNGNDYERLCMALADRIVELADNFESLPRLPEQEGFGELVSLYRRLEDEAAEQSVHNGPDGVNVVYLVGNRGEMKCVTEKGVEADGYPEDPQDWVPFPQAPGAHVKMLTEEGANAAGMENHRHFSLPSNLLQLVEAAKKRNSPVLLVLDRYVVLLPKMLERLGEYTTRHFDHCGLVTAGGSEVPFNEVQGVFSFRCVSGYPHHMWEVPADREEYVSSVASVLGGIRKYLVGQGPTSVTLSSAPVPGLSGPSRD